MIRIFPIHLREQLKSAWVRLPELEEIRIRIHQPLALCMGAKEYYLSNFGQPFTETAAQAYRIREQDIQELVVFISRYSLYAFEEEIRCGYLTIEGGHRVGVSGHAVYKDGSFHTFRNISYLNIRICKENIGCASPFISRLYRNPTQFQSGIYNTLIISPPGQGKTTLLRDFIRLLSDGSKDHAGLRVSVVDERSEIAGCYLGIPQKEVGMRTDVLDGCTKAEGMMLMIRTMSPQVLAVDELGSTGDAEAVLHAIHCGCSILGTIHAANLEEANKKTILREFLKRKYFMRYLVIEKGTDGMRNYFFYDENQDLLC